MTNIVVAAEPLQDRHAPRRLQGQDHSVAVGLQAGRHVQRHHRSRQSRGDHQHGRERAHSRRQSGLHGIRRRLVRHHSGRHARRLRLRERRCRRRRLRHSRHHGRRARHRQHRQPGRRTAPSPAPFSKISKFSPRDRKWNRTAKANPKLFRSSPFSSLRKMPAKLTMASTEGKIQLALRNTVDTKSTSPAPVLQSTLFSGGGSGCSCGRPHAEKHAPSSSTKMLRRRPTRSK